MIRDAGIDDVPKLVAMGERFYQMAPHSMMGEYDKAAVARMLKWMVESNTAIVLTNDTGAIGGVLAPVYFNPTVLMCEESFWWAMSSGRELLRALEDRAIAMGAHYFMLSTLENARIEAMERIVTREGYEPIERRYMKGLG